MNEMATVFQKHWKADNLEDGYQFMLHFHLVKEKNEIYIVWNKQYFSCALGSNF